MKIKDLFIGLLVFIGSIGIIGSISFVYGSSQFSPSYDVSYEVKDSGTTLVTQRVHLTNLTTDYYATEYTLTYGTDKIDNVVAWDRLGPLKTDVTYGNNLTQIHVAFNDKVAGVGKIMDWTLSFTSSEIAQHLGRIWEISLPKVSQEEQPGSYNVTLIVPSSFGEPAYVTPKPVSHFYWTLPESAQGVTLAFGDWQGFKFDLTYHLQNSELVPGRIDIALPSDNAYQKIFLNSIMPSPSKITSDEDGNWLASYSLLPKQNLDIQVKGAAQVFLSPRKDFPQDDETKVFKNYLSSQNYWEQNTEIKRLALELKTPEDIYNYVVKTLSYDYKKAAQEKTPVRLGAQAVLAKTDSAICMEFTDLFIALSRAAGIPAREVDGFAYTSNSKLRPLSLVNDVLHSWPEYWDEEKKIWVQVDPTWGKTSDSDFFNRFDFDHLTFAIRGISSTSPYPAGSYKSKTGGKDVSVDFDSGLSEMLLKTPALAFEFPQRVMAGLPISGNLRISNPNTQALYGVKVNLTSSSLTPKNQLLEAPIIPPMAQASLNFKLNSANPLFFTENTLSASANGETISTTSQVIPWLIFLIPGILLFFLLILFLSSFIKKLWKFLLKGA